jgi:uracil-DNA glycosylase
LAGKNKQLLRGLEQEIQFLTEIGAEFIFAPDERAKAPAGHRAAVRTAAAEAPDPAGAGPKPGDDTREILQALEKRILGCTLCPLSRGRTRAVPGEGDYSAALMFVGEGPGADEDIQGRPFVGRAGQLLTKIIAAMSYSRPDVYITNVVKCRPPQNRTPVREEIEKCRPYLLEQIKNIAPRVIVSLGKVATDFFRPSAAGMSSRRGNFFEYGNILVMPTFHPSYLIRNEGNKEIKKLVWQDMQKVMDALGRK